MATIELALALPLLLILTLGLIEYGWMFLQAQQVSNVARQAARLGARPDATDVDIRQTVDVLMSRAGLGESGYAVAISISSTTVPEGGEMLTVAVGVPYESIRLTGLSFLPVPSQLRSSISMAKEGV